MAENVKNGDGREKDALELLMGLARGLSPRAAGAKSGYSARQAARIAARPATRWEVKNLRRDLLKRMVGRLMCHTTKALKTLRQLLDSKNEAIRLGASRTLLGELIQWHTTLDTSEEIKRLMDELGTTKDDLKKRRGQPWAT
jgi:hypothetical protein